VFAEVKLNAGQHPQNQSQRKDQSMSKTKSKAQIGFLLSNKVSPLTDHQKEKLKWELHVGSVKVSDRYHLPKRLPK
jgi:hypothetical protein